MGKRVAQGLLIADRMTEKLAFTLSVNGRDYPVRVEPRRTLADTIRDDCGLTGTHLGCEHGVCGACTVIVDGEAMRSCLMFAVQAQGKAIRTVEDWRTAINCTHCSVHSPTTGRNADFAHQVFMPRRIC